MKRFIATCTHLLLIVVLGPVGLANAAGTSSADGFVRDILSDRGSFGLSMTLTAIESRETAMEVTTVRAGGPADLAGIEPGDIVVGIDGSLPPFTNDVESVFYMQNRYKAGDEATFEYLSEGIRQDSTLRAELMPEETQRQLLHWIEVAERRIAAGESLYCDVSGMPADRWLRLLSLASYFDFASLDVSKSRSEDLQFATYPPHLQIPEGLALDDFDPQLKSRIAKLEIGQTLRISWTRDEQDGSPTFQQAVEVLETSAD